jgi:pyruvate dehydrogenase E1 component
MPDFWQFPTVSMGLGPLMAIYQARFLKYLQAAASPTPRPQGLGVLRRRRDGRARIAGRDRLAAREKLDNLIFVVNCNLQRLDGPVRGNGKIIQELEGEFPRRRLERHQADLGQLLGPAARARQGRHPAQAHDGTSTASTRLQGQGRRLRARALLRQVPELLEMVADMSDDDIWRLNRGGHDPHKVYAAYHAAVNTRASRP